MAHFAVPKLGMRLHHGQIEVFRNPSRFRTLVAGRRFGKCLAEGTPVWMGDGSRKAIENVVIGDRVLSPNLKTFAMEIRTVVAAECNGLKETTLITTAGRNVVSTPHHPHLVNGEFLRADEVRPGDLIGVARTQPFGETVAPQAELDFLAIWLAGGRKSMFSNSDEAIIDIMRSSAAYFGCEIYQRSAFDWHMRKAGQRSSAASGIQVYLRGHGLYDLDSKAKFIPGFVFSLGREQLGRFLNLWFATDGCITKSGSIEIGLANEHMVRQLSDLLAKFGVHGSVYHKIHAKRGKAGKHFQSWTWSTSAPTSVIAFANNIGALTKEDALISAYHNAISSRGNCNSYLPISYDQFVEQVKFVPEAKGKFGGFNCKHDRSMPSELRLQLNSWRKQTTSRMSVKRYLAMRQWVAGYFDTLLSGDVTWEVVTGVEDAPATVTYDIEVEGNHTFVANGIVTHNTHLAKAEIIRGARGKGRRLIWYVAPTFSMAREIMWDELIEAIPAAWIKKKHETRLEIRLINGTVIQLKGADRPDTLRGRGVDLVILDEFQDFRPEVWTKVIYPTLAQTLGRALIIGTPKSYNHFYDLYRLGMIEKNRRSFTWSSWQFPTIMSPFFPPSEIKMARENLDPKTFRQEFEASFESMAGRVYYAFDRNVHVGKYPFNPKLPIIVGQDFNVDPMSSAIMQVQPNGDVWIVDEIHLPSSNSLETCEELDRRFFRYRSQITLYPDPAGANRASSRGESDLDIFRDRGFRKIIFKKKHPLVSDRVATVNGMWMSADGTVKMYVDERCNKVIETMEQTIYKAGTPTVDKSQGIEHMADAVGYPIHYLYGQRFKKLVGFDV